MNKILLTNIQRFSLHDGPGIRTTVFLKGCSLRCSWCSNPENLLSSPQSYIKDGIEGTYGRYYTPDELIKECLKDKNFYEGKISSPSDWNITSSEQIESLPGGVTFSGGEALLQAEALVPVCQALHRSDVHIAVETCLFIPPTNLNLALEMVDFFYVDVKILDATRCSSVEHGNLDLYHSNLHTLLSWTDEAGHHKPVVIRIPVIGSYTDDEQNRKAVHDLLDKYRDSILKIELIKEHNLGESKYKSLGMQLDYHGVEDELMETYKSELSDLGILTEICKI
jgi:pyruvate formate lyase activating enzyme